MNHGYGCHGTNEQSFKRVWNDVRKERRGIVFRWGLALTEALLLSSI